MSVTDFNNKVAAITGAGSGMGQSLAVLLARAGCHVAISDLNADGLEETRAMLNPAVNVSVHVVDVASREQMEAFAASANTEHSKINMIFNLKIKTLRCTPASNFYIVFLVLPFRY